MIPRAVVALGLALSASAAGAQRSPLTIDLTSARMRYADSVSASALSVTPVLRAATARASVFASGTLSRLGGGTTASGSADASLLPLATARFMPELDLFAGGSTHSDGARTGQFLGTGRLHVGRAKGGAWIGAGAGRTWDGSWRNVVVGEAGAWTSAIGGALAADAIPTSVDDSIRYTDFTLSFTRESPSVDVAASLGARAGDRVPSLPANRSVWGGVTVSFWIGANAALLASAGSYPVDFTQGFPGGRYLSLGFRIATARSGSPPRPTVSGGDSLAGPIRDFDAVLVTPGSMRFRVRAPGAASVDVAGDFTSWSAVPMRPIDRGWWEIVLPVAAGTHQLNVRVDGGAWRVPPGLTPLTDEFGVVSGLLDVPR